MGQNSNLILGQITPWQDEELDLDWLVIVIIPESELIINSAEQQNKLRLQYLAYLLPWLRWQHNKIWMNVRMPVMVVNETTEQIKSYSQTINTLIVAMTAGTLEEERLLFHATGCDDFVGKLFSARIIKEALQKQVDNFDFDKILSFARQSNSTTEQPT